jgi:DNA-binding transcriptional regulator YdaS (Cro superfamily)
MICTMNNPVQKAIDIAGGLSVLATLIGKEPNTVSNWRDRKVPEDSCPAIEKVTLGQVTVCELRADVPWIRIKDKTWPHQDGRPVIDHARAVPPELTSK